MNDERNDQAGDRTTGDGRDAAAPDRRRALQWGAAVAAGAWVAPAILSLDAAAAQSSSTPGGSARVHGRVLCGPFPFGGIDVELDGPGGTFSTVSSPGTGEYALGPVPPGSYTIQAGAEPPLPLTLNDGDDLEVDLQIQCA